MAADIWNFCGFNWLSSSLSGSLEDQRRASQKNSYQDKAVNHEFISSSHPAHVIILVQDAKLGAFEVLKNVHAQLQTLGGSNSNQKTLLNSLTPFCLSFNQRLSRGKQLPGSSTQMRSHSIACPTSSSTISGWITMPSSSQLQQANVSWVPWIRPWEFQAYNEVAPAPTEPVDFHSGWSGADSKV